MAEEIGITVEVPNTGDSSPSTFIAALLTDLQVGEILKWDGENWVNAADQGGIQPVLTNLQVGEILKWDGENWVNVPDAGGIDNVQEDTDPILGGTLNFNAFSAENITSLEFFGNIKIFNGATNVGIGNNMSFITTATQNIGVGTGSLNKVSTGFANTSLGYFALSEMDDGSSNIAIGEGAMFAPTYGYANIAMGLFALSEGNNNEYNVAIGPEAALYLDGAFDNVLVGEGAGRGHSTNPTSYDNTVGLGAFAFYRLELGQRNVAIGFNAADNATSITDSVYVGPNTNASAATGVVGELVFGTNATGQGSNTATYGHTTITDSYMRGLFHADNINIGGYSTPSAVATFKGDGVNNIAEWWDSAEATSSYFDTNAHLWVATMRGVTQLFASASSIALKNSSGGVTMANFAFDSASVASVTFRNFGVKALHPANANWDLGQSGTTAWRDLFLSRHFYPGSSADASAPNGTLYYSTDAAKLVYKDSTGTVNALY